MRPAFVLEYAALQLAPPGRLRSCVTLREAAWGDPVTDVRVGPGGALYELASSPAAGVQVARYSLAPAP
jgi:hypothetical protein